MQCNLHFKLYRQNITDRRSRIPSTRQHSANCARPPVLLIRTIMKSSLHLRCVYLNIWHVCCGFAHLETQYYWTAWLLNFIRFNTNDGQTVVREILLLQNGNIRVGSQRYRSWRQNLLRLLNTHIYDLLK